MENQTPYTVITGASSGIGRAAAKAFAERGKNLVIAARREEKLEELKNEILSDHPDLDILVKVVDLSDSDQVRPFYEELQELPLETWINDAGFGNYDSVARQDLNKIEAMLRLNVEALTVLSTLFVRDHRNAEGAQLINLSSAGGYTIVPTAVTYCAAKFYVSAFTEGLARELQESGAKLKAKVLAPAATKTEFGQVANDVAEYDYDQSFGRYHSAEEMAGFLMKLYDSDSVVGSVDLETFEFRLTDPVFSYAGGSEHNQRIQHPFQSGFKSSRTLSS